MSVLAKRLKEARKKAGLSQERLGILAGMDEMSASARMNQYEKGKHTPDLNTLQRIAKVLKTPAAYFYAEDDKMAWMIQRFNVLDENAKKSIMILVEVFTDD